MGREIAGRLGREETWVYLWLILVDVWQKTTKFYKANVLQFKKFKKNKESACQSKRHQVPLLVQEDSTCLMAIKPVHHSYATYALESRSHNNWSPCALEPVLCNKRSHHMSYISAKPKSLEYRLHFSAFMPFFFFCLDCFFSWTHTQPLSGLHVEIYPSYKARLKHHLGQEGFPDAPQQVMVSPSPESWCSALGILFLSFILLHLLQVIWIPAHEVLKAELGPSSFQPSENSTCSRGLVTAWWAEFGGITSLFCLFLIMSLIPRQNEIWSQDWAETKLL